MRAWGVILCRCGGWDGVFVRPIVQRRRTKSNDLCGNVAIA
jgi:hypothetical protein